MSHELHLQADGTLTGWKELIGENEVYLIIYKDMHHLKLFYRGVLYTTEVCDATGIEQDQALTLDVIMKDWIKNCNSDYMHRVLSLGRMDSLCLYMANKGVKLLLSSDYKGGYMAACYPKDVAINELCQMWTAYNQMLQIESDPKYKEKKPKLVTH